MLVAVVGAVRVAEVALVILEVAAAETLAASPGGRLRQRRQESFESEIGDVKRRLRRTRRERKHVRIETQKKSRVRSFACAVWGST